ncbi:MAG: transcriptional regulator [Deltaproteobacteria bacterium HGW-Deltaproteobacteria-3]|nr:MAG: transcriptional regulator [Deltaproteobacteria bacterium HGW-Deltaproteobacteria-3]
MPIDRCQCRIVHEQQVEKARKSALPPAEIDKLAQFLLALHQEEMCVCDLAAFLGVSESAVSHQLRLLRQMALVANRREGPVLYYRLTDAHVSQLVLVALDHIRE